MTKKPSTEELLRRAIPHVYRQQHHGRHEQDRQDAAELMPLLDAWKRDSAPGDDPRKGSGEKPR